MMPMNWKDAYKIDHRNQYPKGTTSVYSNFTARDSRIPGINKVVVFGIQAFVQKYLKEEFAYGFFALPKDEVVEQYQRRINGILGPNAISMDHIEALHDLGYLPVEIKALPEGTLCPLRVPMLTIVNTLPEFFWVTNFLETLISCSLWHPMTSATIAFEYRKVLDAYAKETSDMPEFVQWQGHDFSMRGHTSLESATASGAAHLLSFLGSDTIPAIDYLEYYYFAKNENIANSVGASEHSVMTMCGKDAEAGMFRRLMTEVYPSGIVSIVSDSYDYWKVVTETIPSLKKEIMARDGKVVVRPDTGIPELILCGDFSAPEDSPEFKGTVELLWETFGGTVNSKGFKQLDSHIGVIYGDSITLERCKKICAMLKAKGFATTNVVLGIGSFSYQMVTRDTFGFAMKATHGVVDGISIDIYKDPKTDIGGIKKSAKGLLRVNNDLTLSEQVSVDEEKQGMLTTVFKNGEVYNKVSLQDIRAKLLGNL